MSYWQNQTHLYSQLKFQQLKMENLFKCISFIRITLSKMEVTPTIYQHCSIWHQTARQRTVVAYIMS